jgi:hypothetical protein
VAACYLAACCLLPAARKPTADRMPHAIGAQGGAGRQQHKGQTTHKHTVVGTYRHRPTRRKPNRLLLAEHLQLQVRLFALVQVAAWFDIKKFSKF